MGNNVIVIGAGAAGMMAAIIAAENGASVTILDKDSAFVDSCQMITINMGDRKKYFYASQIEGNSPYYYIQCEKKAIFRNW